MLLALIVSIATVSAEPVLFTGPESVKDARGIEWRAQLPEETQVLQAPAGPEWFMPVSALPLQGKTGIWYQRVEKTQKEYLDQRVLCLGLYADGAWTLPEVGEGSLPWGGPNNVVMRRSPFKPTWGGFNQHQILRDGDRFHMLYWDQPARQGEAGVMVASSTDGLHWEKDPRGTVFTEHNDAFTALAKDGGYLLYQTVLEDWPDKPYPDNLDKFRRVQSLRESKDFVTWTGQAVFLRPDAQDPPETEFYLMKAFPYAGRYAGILMKYFADPKVPNKHSSILKHELMLSDDARTWRRPFRETDLGFFTFADPFVDTGRLCFASWKNNAITLFKYRPNRLIGATAEGEGTFTTPPLTFPRPALDADASKGWIEVEWLDTDGNPAPNTQPTRIEGKNDEAIALPQPPTQGKPYRLKLRLHAATVYALHDTAS
jgi:hypothetical protein